MKTPADYVDPFHGVDGGGNTLCGPYLPHGIVRLGSDTVDGRTNGYRSDRPIRHFSHTHVSGTGGGGRYGNVGLMPFTGPLRLDLDPEDKRDEAAGPGYYAVTLATSGVRCELTCTPRTGLHRYTFPEGENANLLIDAGAVIQVAGMPVGERAGDTTGMSTGGYIAVQSPTEIVGRADCRGGWGHNQPYSVYFYIRLSAPIVRHQARSASGVSATGTIDGPGSRLAVATAACHRLEAAVGVSYASVAHARASVEKEIASRTFDDVRAEAKGVWNLSLSRIDVEGSESDKSIFYSLFTRLLCMPSDLGVDDEFAGWRSGLRHFTDYFTLWDAVRNTNAMYILLDPALHAEMMTCLLDIADRTGWLPDVWTAGHAGYVQGGINPDVMICEAALKGVQGIDYRKALGYILKNGESESPNPYFYGRFLPDYRDMGYLTTAHVPKGCVSRTIEYSYQDWCAGRLAEHLGGAYVAMRRYESSRNLWNLWRDDLKCFAPRDGNGQWVEPFDPMTTIEASWDDPYVYEAKPFQWALTAPHTFHELIERHGGAEAFIRHLDWYFDNEHHQPREVLAHVPYLYTYAGRPDRTCERVRAMLRRFYETGRRGLHENEDMGSQASCFMFSAMGFYPVMGQDLYLLATPVFDRTTFALGAAGRTLEIRAPGAAAGTPYIASARLNGVPLDRAWLRHSELTQGGRLEFTLADRPGSWAADTPPPGAERI